MVSVEQAVTIANWVFFVGGIAFTVALLPSLLSKKTAIPWTSSALTAFWLWAYAFVFYLLDTPEALAAEVATATAWTLLLIYRRPKPEKKPSPMYETSTHEVL